MRIVSLAVGGVFAACVGFAQAEEAIDNGQFFFGDLSVKITELKRGDVFAFLESDWSKFDRHAKDTVNLFSGQKGAVYWYPKVTPPLPTNWPPQKPRSLTYYAYAEYQELHVHGPTFRRSAPWAKVVLNEDKPAEKLLLAADIGPVVHGEGSVPLTEERANRKRQIIKDGEAHLAKFVRWIGISNDKAEVLAIREYYCQWALTDHTADLIKENHRPFFEWLACPRGILFPVLP